MSIAVSATLKSSRLWMLLSALMSFAVFVSAFLFWQRPNDYIPEQARLILALVCVIAALVAFFILRASQKICRIDISASGQIWLTHTTRSAVSGISGITPAEMTEDSELVSLLGDSTLCSNFMLLRLQTCRGQIRSCMLLPDSLDRRTLRALCVACRWIAAQASPQGGTTGDQSSFVG